MKNFLLGITGTALILLFATGMYLVGYTMAYIVIKIIGMIL